MLSDAETVALVRSAQRGDADALSCLVAQHRATLVRFCRRLMGDGVAGEDLAQEALLRAQLSVGRLGPPYRFGPWLLGIAANLAKKAWRSEARRPMSWEGLVAAYPNVEWDESLTVVPSPEQRSEAAEEIAILTEAIGALPRWLSHVLVLHYVEGLSYAEVADALALPVSTVKGRLFESRSRLRQSLTASGVRELNGASRATPQTGRARPSRASRTRPQSTHEGTDMSNTPSQKTNRVGVGQHLRVEVDVDALTKEATRFLTEPWPRPRPKEALDELASPRNRFLSVQVLEYMVLDGASAEKDVRPFVDYCVAESGLARHSDPEIAALTDKLRARAAL